MKNVIFYFTGTGNSLSLSRKLAERIGDTEIFSITENCEFSRDVSGYEKIGFVFPVYYWHVPTIVDRFVNSLALNPSQYVFSVASFAGVLGLAQNQMEASIEKSGGKVRGQFVVRMPGNAIAGYNAFPAIIQKILLSRSDKKASQIAKSVRQNQTVKIKKPSSYIQHYDKDTLAVIAKFGEMAGNFHCGEACTLCKQCVKVCPRNNIRVEDNRVIWGSECEQCMACIQWCPQRTIEYANKTQRRRRYRNPEITIIDICGAR